MNQRRAILIVMDSVGIGSLPDAAAYGSAGSDTLGHIAQETELFLPNMAKLGLGNIRPLPGVEPSPKPKGAYGRMASQTAGMDTTSGHWEMAGLVLPQPLPTFAHGFPAEFINALAAVTQRGIIGNCTASGVTIINELGPEHLASGKLIVYTSADSVCQIAAHEAIVPREQLYDYCRSARSLLCGDLGVGRVIARPFIGDAKSGFTRTDGRRDFSLEPPEGGLLEVCRLAGRETVSVGKISDIFAGQHISSALPGHGNDEALASLSEALENTVQGLIFVNLVDFDMRYGHRNDVQGYGAALRRFDSALPAILDKLGPGDMLAITADHGNDPTTPSTDHSREYVPLLVYGPHIKPVDLGTRATFADLGQTVAAFLGAAPVPAGQSFLNKVLLAEV